MKNKMFHTIWDTIEEKILNYFDCPYDPDPKRLKIFWGYVVGLILVALILAILIYAFFRETYMIIGVVLIALVVIHDKVDKPNPKTKERAIDWWHGHGRWYDIFKQ
jgi:uncharacterized membrane protein YdbT with pleckstrin-like domain